MPDSLLAQGQRRGSLFLPLLITAGTGADPLDYCSGAGSLLYLPSSFWEPLSGVGRTSFVTPPGNRVSWGPFQLYAAQMDTGVHSPSTMDKSIQERYWGENHTRCY